MKHRVCLNGFRGIVDPGLRVRSVPSVSVLRVQNLPDSDEREIKWTDSGRAAGTVPRRSPCSLTPCRSISISGWGLFLGLSPAERRLSPLLLPGESLLLSLLALL